MTIVVPNTFDELDKFTDQALQNLKGVAAVIPGIGRDNDLMVMSKLIELTDFSFCYLRESPVISRDELKAKLSYSKAEPKSSFDLLDSYLSFPSETGDEIRTGVCQLAQAALDLRAPLGQNMQAHGLLEFLVSNTAEELGVVWRYETNPAEYLIGAYNDVFGRGSEIPFTKIKHGIEHVNGFVKTVTRHNGPDMKEVWGPKADLVRCRFAQITAIGEAIMSDAEKRLPQPPVPVKPVRMPIFTKTAACAV